MDAVDGPKSGIRKTNAPTLSIVIATWNSASEITDCLQALRIADRSAEIFVVDNASIDATVELVRTNFPDVMLLENRVNAGFARANNQALALARGDNLLLLNPDTVVEPDALQLLCAYLADHPRVGAVGPRLIRPDGTIQRSCLRYVTLPALLTGFVQGGDYLPADPTAPGKVEALSGAALMVRRQVVEEVGLLDEEFFMYAEDTDWCYRMAQAGWELHYCPTATVIHIGGQSAGQVPVETYVRRRMAQLQFMQKHGAAGHAHTAKQFMRLNLALRARRAQGEDKAYYERVRTRFEEQVRGDG